MDVCCQGGYSLGRRLFAEIARQGLRFAFHSWGTALEVMAAAHLGICWPQMVVEWLEYPCYSTPGSAGMYPFPLAAEILTQPLEIERGDLIVPRTPGLGVTVDERVIERYPWIPGPWSLLPHRFARRDARRHQRSQRAVGRGRPVSTPPSGFARSSVMRCFKKPKVERNPTISNR